MTGNYIKIFPDGAFKVGKIYEKDGWRWKRGTKYMTNGKEKKYHS